MQRGAAWVEHVEAGGRLLGHVVLGVDVHGRRRPSPLAIDVRLRHGRHRVLAVADDLPVAALAVPDPPLAAPALGTANLPELLLVDELLGLGASYFHSHGRRLAHGDRHLQLVLGAVLVG